MRKIFFFVCLTVFVWRIAVVYSAPVHDTGKIRCLDCHVVLPSEDAELSFYDDIPLICANCHGLYPCKAGNKEGFSHPNAVIPSMKIPRDMVLDRLHRLTCITCHVFHDSIRPQADMPPFKLRRQPRVTFCYSCHEKLPVP
jgi:hypothetical protein